VWRAESIRRVLDSIGIIHCYYNNENDNIFLIPPILVYNNNNYRYVIISVVGTRRRRVGLRHLRTRHIVSSYSPRQQHQYRRSVGSTTNLWSGRPFGGVGGDGDAIAGPAATILRFTTH